MHGAAEHQSRPGSGATHQSEEVGAGDERSGIDEREVAGFGVGGPLREVPPTSQAVVGQ